MFICKSGNPRLTIEFLTYISVVLLEWSTALLG